jgi:hypothetical protein
MTVASGASGAAVAYESGGAVSTTTSTNTSTNTNTSGQGGRANTGGAPSNVSTGGKAANSSSTGGKAAGGSATGGKAAGGSATGGKAAGATGGSASSTTTNPPITGSSGFATRYWDCCKPSCSWTTAVPSCQKDGTTKISDRNAKSGCDSGGNAYECFNFAPWFDSSTNLSYGFAAFNGVSCGACFMLQFTGDGATASAAAIKGKQMVVQVINIGNIAAGQFDILIPGGGVGERTAGCTAQWGNVDLGATYGGLLTECSGSGSCVTDKCATVFAGKPDLIAGCAWFTGWYAAADNPKIIYKQVTCPSQITSKTGVSG